MSATSAARLPSMEARTARGLPYCSASASPFPLHPRCRRVPRPPRPSPGGGRLVEAGIAQVSAPSMAARDAKRRALLSVLVTSCVDDASRLTASRPSRRVRVALRTPLPPPGGGRGGRGTRAHRRSVSVAQYAAMTTSEFDTALTRQAKIALPIIGGAMYPCSNPELVAAISETGAIGIVQPISLTYVHGHEYRAGLR